MDALQKPKTKLSMGLNVVRFPRHKKEIYTVTAPDLHRALGQLEGTSKMMQEGLSQVSKAQGEIQGSLATGLATISTKLDNHAITQAQTQALASDALKEAQRANGRIDTITAKAMGAGMVGAAVVAFVAWLIERLS